MEVSFASAVSSIQQVWQSSVARHDSTAAHPVAVVAAVAVLQRP